MTTSGTNLYTVTAQQLIRNAFTRATIYRRDDSIPSEDYNTALQNLNEMIKAWQLSNLNIWQDKRAFLFTQYGVAKYTIGSSAGDHATESYEETTLNADVLSGAATIDVVDASLILDGDYIGIVKNDSYIFWTTVNGAPAGNTVTLTDVIDGDADSSKNVYSYTTKITKPLLIDQANLIQNEGNEVLLNKLSRKDYFLMSNKTSIGSPNQFYSQRRRLDTELYIWSTPSDVTQQITFTYQPYFDNIINQSDELDFPIEWSKALTWGLALELCSEYGIGIETYQKTQERAGYWFDMAQGSDNEDTELTFG